MPHPYRTPAKPAQQTARDLESHTALDVESAMFFMSVVVLLANVLEREFGVITVLATLGLVFSGRRLLRAALQLDL